MPKLREYPQPESSCPTCGYKFDASTPVGGSGLGPAPGCLSLCMMCGEILIFDDNLWLKLPTEQDMKKLKGSPAHRVILKAQQVLKQLHTKQIA